MTSQDLCKFSVLKRRCVFVVLLVKICWRGSTGSAASLAIEYVFEKRMQFFFDHFKLSVASLDTEHVHEKKMQLFFYYFKLNVASLAIKRVLEKKMQRFC